MIKVSDQQFEQLISDALEEITKSQGRKIDNVAIIYQDEPSSQQRKALKLNNNQTLYGLYEGIPLSKRQGARTILPDKITIYKKPMEMSSANMTMLKAQVKHTLWHEIAHYYGLNHDQINKLD